MNKIDKLPPFKRFCVTIGNLPSSYVDSMSYYECIMWLCNYLENTVIPAVNENAEAVNELINWFNNLDVQEEINNKLDEMAESGELEEIIGVYVNANCILAFNTVADMVASLNLVAGSVCRTLGGTTYNDGYGAIYRVKTMTAGDVVDGVNKIALDVSDTLIAELIPFTKVKPEFLQCQRNAIYIGNSYTDGVGATNYNGIYNRTKDLFKSAYKFTGSGAGLLAYADHEDNNFITLLQDAIDSTSIDKTVITDIIFIGAWGDSEAYHEFGKSDFVSGINTASQTLVSMIKTNYPNVDRISYIWAEGRQIQNPSASLSHPSNLSDEFNVHNLLKFLLPRNGISYLGWIGFNITLNSAYFSSDKIHPNDLGYEMLASSFKSAYCGNLVYKNIEKSVRLSSPITSDSTMAIRYIIEPDKWTLNLLSMNLKTGDTPVFGNATNLLNFLEEDICLPIPFDETTNLGWIKIQTQPLSAVDYDPKTEYVGKIDIRKTSDSGNTSTRIYSQGFSNTVTVSNELQTAMIISGTIICGLEYR